MLIHISTAIKAADVEAVKQCIAAGVDVNPITNKMNAQDLPLSIAFKSLLQDVHEGMEKLEAYLAIFQLLRQAGARLDQVSKEGNTFLHQLLLNHWHLEDKPSYEPLAPLVSLKKMPQKEKQNEAKQNIKKTKQALLQIATILLKAGLSPKALNYEKQTPFSLALTSGFEEMVLLFFNYGVDIHYCDHEKNTILHVIAQRSIWPLFHKFIDEMKLNAINIHQCTSLDVTYDAEMILALLRRGAKANHRDFIDFFMIAESCYDKELMDFLFKNGIATYKRASGETALFVAKSKASFARLIEEGADIHAPYDQGFSSSYSNSKSIKSHQQKTIFSYLFSNINSSENFEKIQLLIEKGVSDIPTETTFHLLIPRCDFISSEAQICLLHFWLKQGAKINGVDDNGNAPLHVAAQAGAVAITDFLIEQNANVHLQNHQGEMALDVLNVNSPYISPMAILQTLWQHYPKERMPKNYLALTAFIIQESELDFLKTWYEAAEQCGVSLAPEYLWKLTIDFEQDDIAEWLLSKPILLEEIRIQERYTCLQYAILRAQSNMVSLLVKHLSDNSLPSSLWLTWLESFIMVSKPKEREKIFQLLLEKNVPTEMIENTGKSLVVTLIETLDFPSTEKLPYIRKLLSLNKTVLIEEKLAQQWLAYLDRLRAYDVIQWSVEQNHLSLQMLETLLKKNGNSFWLNIWYAAKREGLGLLLKQCQPFIIWNIQKGLGIKEQIPYLHLAVQLRSMEIVQLLLTQHLLPFNHAYSLPVPSHFSEQAITPLELATYNDSKDFILLLLPYYAKSALEAKELMICLEWTVSHKNIALFEIFFSFFKIHQLLTTKEKDYLFYLACEKQFLEAAEHLLVAGCNVNSEVPREKISIGNYVARQSFSKYALKEKFLLLLLDHGAKFDLVSLFFIFVKKEMSLALVEKIFNKINPTAFLPVKPLHMKVSQGQYEITKFILEKYPELLESRDGAGCTPLLRAVVPDNHLIVNYLIQKKADLNARDYTGQSINWYALCWGTSSTYQLSVLKGIELQEFQLLKLYIYHLPEAMFLNKLSISEYAAKLLWLFKTRSRVLDYIKKFQSNMSKQPLHDLCLFDLPPIGEWDAASWAKLVFEYGLEITQYLAIAPQIEALLKRPPHSLKEIEDCYQEASYYRESEHPEMAAFFIRHQIPETTFHYVLDSYKPKKQDYLPDVKVEGEHIGHPRYYFKKLASDDWRGFVLGKMTHCCQSIGSSGHPCAEHGMTSPYGGFYALFKLSALKKIKKLTNLLEWATSASTYEEFLKKITDKVQRKKYQELQTILSKNFISTSDPILKALVNQLNQKLSTLREGELVAQCWAWISLNGHLVFDSWERLRPEDDALCAPFLQAAAKEILSRPKNTIEKILLGKGGQTPTHLTFATEKEEEFPRDYTDYRDSSSQYKIAEQSAFLLQDKVMIATKQNTKLGYNALLPSSVQPSRYFAMKSIFMPAPQKPQKNDGSEPTKSMILQKGV